jgi:hypothetical protein
VLPTDTEDLHFEGVYVFERCDVASRDECLCTSMRPHSTIPPNDRDS